VEDKKIDSSCYGAFVQRLLRGSTALSGSLQLTLKRAASAIATALMSGLDGRCLSSVLMRGALGLSAHFSRAGFWDAGFDPSAAIAARSALSAWLQ
jgi:hypothetical protein